MDTLKRMKWRELDPGLRGELEAILAAHRRKRAPLAALFHNDSDQFMPFVLLGFLAAVGGLIACVYLIASDTLPDGLTYGEHLKFMLGNPVRLVTSPEGGVIGCALVALLLLTFWVRHRGRRGLALTERAVVIVRGPRVRVLPLSEIAESALSARGSRGKRFTVLTLTLKDGRRKQLIATRDWADVAEARIAAAR